MASSHLFQHASGFHISGPSFVINASQSHPSGDSSGNASATSNSSSDSGSSDSFTRIPASGESQASHEIYVHSLLVRKHGLPVWRPDPQGTHVPAEYNTSGVQIGDVGFVANDGSFEYVFNITLPAHHPVNQGRTPPGFIPISFSDALTRTHSLTTVEASFTTVASRCRTVEDRHKPGDLISHPRIRCLRLDSTDSQESSKTGLGAGYKITTSAPRGAILIIPEGGLSRDMINYRDFLSYAQQNAVSWYSYINGTLGRQVPNGALYLVTGYDKASCWGVAAFSNPDGEELIMRFRQNPATVQMMDGDTSSANPSTSSGRRWWAPGPLLSSLMGSTSSSRGSEALPRPPRKLKWSEKYYWIQDSVIDTSARSGPESFATVPSADEDADSTNDVVKNQCLFIRGYKISLGEKSMNPFAGVEVTAKDIGDLEPDDLRRLRMGGDVPFGLGSDSSSSSTFGSSGYSGSSSGLSHSDSQQDRNSVHVLHVPELEAHKTMHPSDNINDYLLKTSDGLEVALTHDEEWMSLLGETDQDLPDRDTLLARLPLKFKVISENGRAHLADIGSTTGSYSLDSEMHTAVTPNFFISTSSSFILDMPPKYSDSLETEEGSETERVDDGDDGNEHNDHTIPSTVMPTNSRRRHTLDMFRSWNGSKSFKSHQGEEYTTSQTLQEKSPRFFEQDSRQITVKRVLRFPDLSLFIGEMDSEKPPAYEERPLRNSSASTIVPSDLLELTQSGWQQVGLPRRFLSAASSIYSEPPTLDWQSEQNTNSNEGGEGRLSSCSYTNCSVSEFDLISAGSDTSLSLDHAHQPTLSTEAHSQPDHSPSTVRTTLPLGLPTELTQELQHRDHASGLDDEDEISAWTLEIPLELLEAQKLEAYSQKNGSKGMLAEESSRQGSNSSHTLTSTPSLPPVPPLPSQLKKPTLGPMPQSAKSSRDKLQHVNTDTRIMRIPAMRDGLLMERSRNGEDVSSAMASTLSEELIHSLPSFGAPFVPNNNSVGTSSQKHTEEEKRLGVRNRKGNFKSAPVAVIANEIIIEHKSPTHVSVDPSYSTAIFGAESRRSVFVEQEKVQSFQEAKTKADDAPPVSATDEEIYRLRETVKLIAKEVHFPSQPEPVLTTAGESSNRSSVSYERESTYDSSGSRHSIKEGKRPARSHDEASGAIEDLTLVHDADARRTSSPPSHAVLKHLCTSSIRNGILGVAVSQRYHEKFVTTTYYKPLD